MITKERIEEANRNVRQYLSDGLLRAKDDTVKKFVGFLMDNATSSLETAALLHTISDDGKVKNVLKVSSEFESYLWVIVSSYYSMFYAATALLASEGIKATGGIVHKVTADALIHFFVANRKLAKMMGEYDEAKDVVGELVGREEFLKRIEMKANELVVAYESERRKRSQFQYDTGVLVKRGFAETSLSRAKRFVEEVRKILAKP